MYIDESGVTRDKYFVCTNFCGLGLLRKDSKNLSHAKINTPMVCVYVAGLSFS